LKEETGIVAERIIHKNIPQWIYATDPSKCVSVGTCCIAICNGDLEVNKERV